MYIANESNEHVLLCCKKEGIDCTFVAINNFIVVKSNNYHFHSGYEIHIPVSGSMHILAEDIDISVYPGEVCIIPPNKTQYVFPDDNSYRIGFRFFYNSTNGLFDKAYGTMDGVAVIKDCDIYNKYLLHAIEYYKNGLPDFMITDMLFHSIYEVASKISNTAYISQKTDVDYSDIRTAEKIEDFMNMNYTKKIHLSDLSEYLNLGNRQTERVTAKHFGVTFSPLLNRKRLATAKFLLKTSDLSIDEISAISGFEDKNYFYRKFSSEFGITPGKYRKLHK